MTRSERLMEWAEGGDPEELDSDDIVALCHDDDAAECFMSRGRRFAPGSPSAKCGAPRPLTHAKDRGKSRYRSGRLGCSE